MKLRNIFKKQKTEPIGDNVKLILEAINKWEGEINSYGAAEEVVRMCEAAIRFGNVTEKQVVEATLEKHNYEAKKAASMKYATETAVKVLMGDKFENATVAGTQSAEYYKQLANVQGARVHQMGALGGMGAVQQNNMGSLIGAQQNHLGMQGAWERIKP